MVDLVHVHLVKVLFRLERDERGWPPIDVEGMWAKRTAADEYTLHNIPFYARGVASGDVVATVEIDGNLYFRETLRQGGHGTIRVLLKSESQADGVIARIESFRCGCESAERLVAVDVPPKMRVSELLSFLEAERGASRLGYEVSCKSW